jgi:hypothetical protein
MGAWSIDAFGNDDAADWAQELEEAEDLSLIEEAIDAVLGVGTDYLEAPEAAVAVAAIEVLARLGGSPGETSAYSEAADEWVARQQAKPGTELIDKAQAAIARILADDSELSELWQESEDHDAWRAGLEALGSRLSGATWG